MKNQTDFLVFKPSRSVDPDGTRLAAALRSTQAFERARSRRDALIYVQAAAGGPVWLVLAGGGAGGTSRLRSLSLALWAVSFLALVAAFVAQWWCYKKRAFWVDALGDRPKGGGR